MASDKGWYLIAVGVLALGLGNTLANSHPDWLQNLTDRSIMAAEQVSGTAEGYLAVAQIMFGRGESGFSRTQAALGQMQARLGVVQANLARHQTEMARVQAENMRVVTMQQVREIRIACPRPRVVIAQLP